MKDKRQTIHTIDLPGTYFRVVVEDPRDDENWYRRKHDPIVKFFDRRMAGEHFTPDGQQAGNYYLSTLLELEGASGLNLDGGIPDWTVPGLAMRVLAVWLEELYMTCYPQAKQPMNPNAYKV